MDLCHVEPKNTKMLYFQYKTVISFSNPEGINEIGKVNRLSNQKFPISTNQDDFVYDEQDSK
jgi:hypothetical protein